MAFRPKTLIYWHPEQAMKLATELAVVRMNAAADLLANKVRSNLKTIIAKNGNQHISRPEYKHKFVNGKWVDVQGPWWTARTAGELLYSVRVVKNANQQVNRDVWVMVGQKKAYYAAMFEYATKSGRGEPFWRPAIKSSRQKMISVFERGV